MIIICQNCKQEFDGYRFSAGGRLRKYCTPRCSQLAQRNKKVVYTDEWRKNIGKAMRGRKFTDEHRKKIGLVHKGITKHPELSKRNRENIGEKSPAWKGGISPINARIRSSENFLKWRKAVFKRDNYTCVKCGKKGNINADHIKPFSIFPELRFDINNGQTLCIECHKVKTRKDIKKIRNAYLTF